MIRYTLRCEKEHEFEAWFRSSADYDSASAAHQNLCPVCGSHEIGKAPMAPAVAGTKHKDAMRSAAPGVGDRAGDRMSLAAPDPRSAILRQALREFRQKVTENADDVGDKFAEEARKIHYNESEPRGIYGQATADEAEALLEEGIGFHPLPDLPEDQN